MKVVTNPMHHSYRVVMPILIKLSELRMYGGTVSLTENFGRTTIKLNSKLQCAKMESWPTLKQDRMWFILD